MHSTLIKIKNITKNYGKKKVLDDISFTINKGEIIGLVGKSGSGKTTLLQLMCGLIKPSIGEIEYYHNNKRIFPYRNKKAKNLFGFSTQETSFYPELTVEENLYYFGVLYGIKRSELLKRIEEILNFIELEKDRKTIASNLSGGMQKRLDIGCSIIHNPKILFLDEPTADLDPSLRKNIWNLIKKINEQGTTVLIASHFLEELENNCDRFFIIYGKKIYNIGTMLELKNNKLRRDEIHLETAPGNYDKIIEYLKSNKEITTIRNLGYKIIIITKRTETTLSKIIEALKVNKEYLLDIEIKKSTLKNIFNQISTKKESKTKKDNK